MHAERARLLDHLERLSPDQWRAPTLCADWTVEEVVAHLVAAARTGTGAWLASMLRARFDPARHNARMVQRHRGATAERTHERFREAVPLTVAASKDLPAFLGEVIVHAQDVARPLGLDLVPDEQALLVVAEFFVARDFAVDSRSLVDGVRLEATDVDFASGRGPVASGTLLDLVMSMAGRPAFADELVGPGAVELRARLSARSAGTRHP